MNKWTGGCMNGRTEGLMDGWMDEQTYGRTDNILPLTIFSPFLCYLLLSSRLDSDQ
jgi:hypothetical protein